MSKPAAPEMRRDPEQHPLIRKAHHDIASGAFTPPRDRALFWSGCDRASQDAPVPGMPTFATVSTHRGYILAYAEAHAAEPPPHLSIRETEMGTGFTAVWSDRAVPGDVKTRLGDMASRAFAETASGTITVAVDNSDSRSFFRRVEFPAILKNDAITHVRVLTDSGRDAVAEQVMPKADWVRRQRAQWLDHVGRTLDLAVGAAAHGRIPAPVMNSLRKSAVLELEQTAGFLKGEGSRDRAPGRGWTAHLRDQARPGEVPPDLRARAQQILAAHPDLAARLSSKARSGFGVTAPTAGPMP